MDLLETILRAARAEKYLEKFKNEDIDAQSLKILTQDDLLMMGIDDEEVRNNIIDKAEKLLISSERKVNRQVNDEYAQIILLHVSSQLKMQNANLICAAERPDAINCNIMLDEAVVSLLASVQDFKKDLQKLKLKVNSKLEKKSLITRKRLLYFTTFTTLLICGNLFIFKKIW